MRLALALLIALSGCAKGQPQEASAPMEAPQPKVYDSCTYSSGFVPQPLFICVETVYVATAHPELDAALFAGQGSLVVREDYRSVPSLCGPFHQPCSLFVQGPGPLAIPQEGI